MKSLILIFFFLSFSIFANDLPELGSSADNLLSSKDEKRIKFEILNRVNQSNQLIDDPEINDYLNQIGKKLSIHGTKEKPDILFFIVNDSSINAFAMLGGIIGVHSGLMLAANSESELASVLSHEIAHITQKHLLRLFESQQKNSFKSYIGLAIAILAARSSPQLANSAIIISQAAGVQDALDYTRSNEKEADSIGLEILNKSGYDPKGFVDFFKTLQKFNEFVSGTAPSFLRTHPITVDRISDIQNRIKDYSFIQRANSLDFYLTKSKLKVVVGDINTLSSNFERKIATKTYFNRIAELYGLTYAYLSEKRNNEALKTFQLILKENINHPMLIELEARVLISNNNFNAAQKLYYRGLETFPNYRAFIYGLSNILIYRNQTKDAIELIKKYQSAYGEDPKLFKLLSEAYAKNGEDLLQFESLSDFFYYRYDIQAAITQMDMATKAKKGTFYDKSRVEYRLQELKREFELINI